MARINLCFVWHMHQPFYRDLLSGDYRLPWVRLHALKDYYGMVNLLAEFPRIRQTFNLVPSLLQQLEDYSAGDAKDRHLQLVSKEAESLTRSEKRFLLDVSFQANEERMIQRFPRYYELWERAQESNGIAERSLDTFSAGMLRDLQVLSQLVWFDEEYLADDAIVHQLCAKGRDFTVQDQRMLIAKQHILLAKVVESYRQAAARGQIEISTSPFYHPILPLICDSNVAEQAHPYMALPSQFRYPADAFEQLREARSYIAQSLGVEAAGLWPPEGAVSNEVLRLAAQAGFRWTASDRMILQQSLKSGVSHEDLYRPYTWRHGSGEMNMIFRDDRLSNLIGMAYARMDADDAAHHFINEVHRACDQLMHAGRDALVAIVLDGENIWEHYEQNGRPFLRALYRELGEDPAISAVTVSEALKTAEPRKLAGVAPGSWIDGNFDIWIGAKEDNQAWELLLKARRHFEQATRGGNGHSPNTALAQQELMIAEGSDWTWWYGPEHAADSRWEFDALFRGHLANVYRLLGGPPPPELSTPLVKAKEPQHVGPTGMIQPVIDGRHTSKNEWAHAGRYRAHHTSGPMHSQGPPLRELLYGSDGKHLYLWLGQADSSRRIGQIDLTLRIRNVNDERFSIQIQQSAGGLSIETALADGCVQAAAQDGFEVRISLAALHAKPGSPLFVKAEVRENGLPMGSLPAFGDLELKQTAVAAYTF